MNKVNKKYVVSFPHIGNYYVPVYNFLNDVLGCEDVQIMIPQNMSERTKKYGEESSPDYVCTPFKYNMGNFIESLENGANVLIQAGGGCRYGYYAEVQEKILRDMGYDFKYIILFTSNGVDVKNLYSKFKEINPNLNFVHFVSRFIFTLKLVTIIDKFENYYRDNRVFEKEEGSFDKLHKKFLNEIKNIKGQNQLHRIKNYYFKELYNLGLIDKDKQQEKLKIGIVGELYSSMEEYSSFYIEKELYKMGVKTKRYTTATYLLINKPFQEKKLIKKAEKYISFALGADGTETVAHTLELIDEGYDGIIHIKPFGCTPEINAMPMLQKISNNTGIPIIYFTFDMQSSEVGIRTRLEAFYDMLIMKKEKEESKEVV